MLVNTGQLNQGVENMERRIMESLQENQQERRVLVIRREQERREARGIKLTLRDMWSTEESESC
jgi:hypothetical protein